LNSNRSDGTAFTRQPLWSATRVATDGGLPLREELAARLLAPRPETFVLEPAAKCSLP
jgi:hypothetical protein